METPLNGPVRLSALTGETEVGVAPDAVARAALADRLGISAVRKLRLSGRLIPDGARDWRLEAMLGATVVQPCVATGVPVTTRIDEPVTRSYLAEMPPVPEGDEIEMPEDETAEPLPETLDLDEVMAEALALALPPWPRAEDAEPVEISVSEPGAPPMTDDDAKPFAGLRDLKEKLEKKDENGG